MSTLYALLLLRNTKIWKTHSTVNGLSFLNSQKLKSSSSSSYQKANFLINDSTAPVCNGSAEKKIILIKNDKITPTNLSFRVQDVENKFIVLSALKEPPILHDAQSQMFVIYKSLKNIATTQDEVVKKQIFERKLVRETKGIIESAGNNLLPDNEIELFELSDQNSQDRPTQLSKNKNQEIINWKPQKVSLSQLPSIYASLAKSRLTGLVVLTAVAGYVIAPIPFDPIALICCTTGIALVSASANTINQFLEVPFDSQMDRTKNRVLVRGLITPLHAVSFGIASGITGIGILYMGTNAMTAALGVVNLLLYTSIYTPMKRLSIINTWVGSVVGAIPPLIGWCACTGSLEPGAWIMAGILFAWQFPHFNALSWNLRKDYSRGGYRMMSVINPRLCKVTALRYSLAMVGICTAAPLLDVTTWTFAADSLPLNLYLSYLSWKFYQEGDSKSSRKLFGFSLIHLPALLILMIISKKHSNHNNKNNNLNNLNEQKLISPS